MSIAEAFEGVLAAHPPPDDPPPPKVAVPPRTATRVRPDAAVGDGGRRWLGCVEQARARAGRWASVVAGDVRGSWLLQDRGPSVASVWAQRVPDVDRVPGENRALWVSWLVFNHAVLAVLVPLMVVFWVLQHPGRLLLALPVVVPVLVLWLAVS